MDRERQVGGIAVTRTLPLVLASTHQGGFRGTLSLGIPLMSSHTQLHNCIGVVDLELYFGSSYSPNCEKRFCTDFKSNLLRHSSVERRSMEFCLLAKRLGKECACQHLQRNRPTTPA